MGGWGEVPVYTHDLNPHSPRFFPFLPLHNNRTIPIKIKDFYLQGRMRCEMDLVPRYPHVQTASFTFLETPICDFDVQPMGVSVMEVPYLAAILQSQIVHGINEHLLDPAKVVFNLIETQSEATSIESADGILFVTLLEARLPSRGGTGGNISHAHNNVVVLNGCAYYMKLQLGEEMMFSREVEEDNGTGDGGMDSSGEGSVRSIRRGNRMPMLVSNVSTISGTTGTITPRRQNRLGRALTAHLNLHNREPPQPRLPFGGETFAFLVGGNVGAVDTVQLTLKQKRTTTSRTVCSLTVPLEEALDPNAPEGGSRLQVPLLDGQVEGGGQFTLGLRYVRLPEVVLEQTQTTVIHRVNERTLSPVNVDADSLGLLKETDHPHAGSLVVIVHKAEELPSLDVHGVRDSYAVVLAGEREVFRTKTAPTKTLAPEWEQSKEFSTFDVRRVKLTVAIFDSDRGYGEKAALAEVDLNVRELFTSEEAVNFGRRVARIHKRYFRLRKPGAAGSGAGSGGGGGGGGVHSSGGGKDSAAAEFKQTRKGGDSEGTGGKSGKSYGFLCVSLLFRPLPATAVAPEFTFRATVGNEEDSAAQVSGSSTTKASSLKASKLMAEAGAGVAKGGSPRAGAGSAGWTMSSSGSKSKAARQPSHTPTTVVDDQSGDEEEEAKEKKKGKTSYGFSRFFGRRRGASAAPSMKKASNNKAVKKVVARSTTMAALFGEVDEPEDGAVGEE